MNCNSKKKNLCTVIVIESTVNNTDLDVEDAAVVHLEAARLVGLVLRGVPGVRPPRVHHLHLRVHRLVEVVPDGSRDGVIPNFLHLIHDSDTWLLESVPLGGKVS